MAATTCTPRRVLQSIRIDRRVMSDKKNAAKSTAITKKKLIELLNEDLQREFQAVIAYVNYSQTLKGAAYMNIADELAVHAKEELSHALKIANQIAYLGGMPSV